MMKQNSSIIPLHIDGVRFGRIKGWFMSATGNPGKVRLLVDGSVVAETFSNEYRVDLARMGIGDGYHGFTFLIPPHLNDGCEHDILVVDVESDVSCRQRLLLKDRPLVHIDRITEGFIEGWAYAPKGQRCIVELQDGAGNITRSPTTLPRPDLVAEGAVRESGFRFRSPLDRHTSQSPEVRITVSSVGGDVASVNFMLPPRPPTILIVSGAESDNDASRFYRAEISADQLKKSRVYVTVISAKDFISKLSKGEISNYNIDILILQRVAYDQKISEFVAQLRETQGLSLYEADDLFFKPWKLDEIGIVRSGNVDKKSESYVGSLENRLSLLEECDGAICSTSFLQRELKSLGIESILTRNCLEDSIFAAGAQKLFFRPEKRDNLSLLFMTGSPTHDADFAIMEEELIQFLSSYRNSSLTILGPLARRNVDLLENVKRIPAVSRDEMFDIIMRHDAVLVPLERTSFNTAKSSLKFMEAAAVGSPVIASATYEYSRDIRRSGGGLIIKRNGSWLEALETILLNPNLAHDLGTKAFTYAWNNYRVGCRGDYLWREILRFSRCSRGV